MSKKEINKEARDAVLRTRTMLVLDHPFFGTLALYLKLVEEKSMPTMATDGKHLFYNPDFFLSLSKEHQLFAIAHEVMHNALCHPMRRGNRQPQPWNAACDFAINAILKDSGFQKPDFALYDQKYDGMDADTIYNKFPRINVPMSGDQGDKQQSGKSGGGQGQDQSGKGKHDHEKECGVCSGVRDMPGKDGGKATEGEMREAEVQAKIQVAQAAAVAKAQGKLPGSLQDFVDEYLHPKVNWRDQLRRFVEQAARNDYSWTRPNQRFIAHSFYLPTLYSNEMEALVIGVDTSGSVSNQMLQQFGGELACILETVNVSTVYVVYCDAQVQHVDEYGPRERLQLKAIGRGGTDFRPVFQWVEDEGITPAALIYLTDLMGSFPEQPEYPVLWGAMGSGELEPPFGELLNLDDLEE